MSAERVVMTYKACVDVLRDFKAEVWPEGVPTSKNEIAIRVAFEKSSSNFVLERVVRSKGPHLSQLPETFRGIRTDTVLGRVPQALGPDKKMRKIRTRAEMRGDVRPEDDENDLEGDPAQTPHKHLMRRTRARGGVRGGDVVSGDKYAGLTGTIGWFFHFNGELHGISNWHVAEKGEKITAMSIRDLTIAEGDVIDDKPVYSDIWNEWDFSLAKMTPGEALPEMIDGGPYGVGIAEVVLGDDEDYVTVGAGLAGPKSGQLAAIRTGEVDFGQTSAYFENQLEFTTGTVPGDSGSVVIRESDDYVVGLAFSSWPTVANPLHKLEWSLVNNNVQPNQFAEFTFP